MANTASHDPPDPARVLAGQVHKDDPDAAQSAAKFHNWLLANYRAVTVPLGCWPDGAFSHTGANTLGPTWNIPVISDRHNAVTLTINYTLAGAGSTVTFTADSVSGGASVNSGALAPGGPTETTLPSLTIDVTGDHEDIELRVATTAGGTVTVHSCRLDYTPLTSPLAAQTVSSAGPMGVNRNGADYPWTARHNFTLRDALPILRERPRVLWCWSGLGSIGTADMQEHHSYRTVFRVWPGAEAQGIEVTARAYVNNSAGSAKSLYWQVGDPRGLTNQRFPVECAAAFTGYKELKFVVPEGAYLQGCPYAAAIVGLHVDTGGSALVGESEVDVRRISVWTE